MKVAAVTPSDAAADPQHPDHDRWVKETTLAMEVRHAQRAGLSLRHAEDENAYWLQRAEAKARDGAVQEPAKAGEKKRKTRDERWAERPVVRTFAKPARRVTNADLSPCGRCGVCRRCRREKRIYAMTLKAKREGDNKIKTVLSNLWLLSMQARDLTGQFFGMSSEDANRILERKLEDICDSTIPAMGDWK